MRRSRKSAWLNVGALILPSFFGLGEPFPAWLSGFCGKTNLDARGPVTA
jgi:hypothetical protein